MDKLVALNNIEQVARQRNLFLILTILLAISCAGLTAKLLTEDKKVILVPGLMQEVWLQSGRVSESYLAESSLMYLPLLLDLNHEIVDYNASIICKYVSQSEPIYMKKMQEYFADAKQQYKQFGLSTYFAVKNLEVDSKNLTVIANGILTSKFGDRGLESISISYKIIYEWLSGRLRLKEFSKVLTDKEQELNSKQTKNLEVDK